jgi:hypothetical protein
MNTLLISGCSFVECWPENPEFAQALGCDSTVNLGLTGGSNQRSFRSVIEWIAQNGDPSFVIVPITYITRFELSISNRNHPVDGAWFPVQRYELISHRSEEILKCVDLGRLKDLIDLSYAVLPDERTYWDRLFTDMIMFAGFLRSRNIPYLMFDMVNAFNPQDIKIYPATQKITLIEQDPSIIDFWSFVGNRFMWDTLDTDLKKLIDPLHHHHASAQYRFLEQKLIDHVKLFT